MNIVRLDESSNLKYMGGVALGRHTGGACATNQHHAVEDSSTWGMPHIRLIPEVIGSFELAA